MSHNGGTCEFCGGRFHDPPLGNESGRLRSVTAANPIAAGEKLGPYEILAHIGAGGMGAVWKARDPRLDRIVAIKISAQKFSERFEREARAIAVLNHPHICQVYDVGPDYLVMEFVDGPEIKGPLPLDLALKAATQLAGALEAAHRKSITHRDLRQRAGCGDTVMRRQ